MTATITDEQSAARELVRNWASGAGATDAVRDVEQGDPQAWRRVFDGMAELGLFGVAIDEAAGGAGGTVMDLCAVVEEAARALIPGPVATTALATLVVSDSAVLQALSSGQTTAGAALSGDLHEESGRVSGSVDRVLGAYVLGAGKSGVLLLPVGEHVVIVDVAAPGVVVEELPATDFSRPLARVTLDRVPATRLVVSRRRYADLAATIFAAEAAGVSRWALDTAADYAKVREQFGKPIGSFQAVKHMCAEMLLRSQQIAVAAADAAVAAADSSSDEKQLSIAAAVAAAVGIEASKANAKDCIQVLGGIGITWEHDAHLFLRRAYGIGHFLGGRSHCLRRVAALAVEGVRRELHIDLDSVAHLRPEIAAAVADVAALPVEARQVALADSGLLAPHWPRPYGRDASPAEQLLIEAELGAAEVHRPDLVIGWWAVPTILEAGTPEQIDRFVPATLRGEVTWCQLFSEPGAGSDLASLRTKAVRCGAGWKLSGQKVWTSSAHTAHWGVCLARTDPGAPKHRGITYFLIDMRSPGIVIRPLREITGDELFNEVFFDEVFVPDEMVVGTVDDGWRLARSTLASERVAMAQSSALDTSMEQVLRGFADHGPDHEVDSALTDRLAELLLAAQVGSLLDHRIAELAVSGQDTGAEASTRKLIGVRYRQALEEFRMELSPGGGAVCDETVLRFLNTRCLSIAGGTEQILLTMVGERLLGLPR